MKKLKLNSQHLEKAEVLTKSELKKIIGGVGGSGNGNQGGNGTCTETCPGLLTSCTSSSGDCDHTKNGAGFIVSISCDGKTYDC